MWLLQNKMSVRDDGLLEGFCDFHSHLLPGVDDGIQEMQETLHILMLWEQVGVRRVWLTPHIMEDFPNTPHELKNVFDSVVSVYQGKIQLHLAAENMMDNMFLNRLRENCLLPIGQKGQCLLVETSYYNPPMDMDEIIKQIKERGLTPILAHPERYQYMDMEDYRKWKERGLLLQMNIPSLVGAYGMGGQKKAEKLLDRGMYDLCGTDIHSLIYAEEFLDSIMKKKTFYAIRHLIESQSSSL